MAGHDDKTQLDNNQATVVQAPSEAPVLETLVLSKVTTKKEKPKKRRVEAGDVLNERFELVELLGSGGMGSVYRARDLRQVEAGDEHPWLAVKVINDNFASHEKAFTALQQETKKTQRLAHPNIVSVYDFDRDGSVAFMTMELLQGQSLDKVIKANPSGLEKEKALEIIRQIVQAINYAHKLGMVHADLKPANIFMCDDGRVKVLDFGIAQAIHEENRAFDAHSLQALTPAYASINMLAGQRPEKKDDLYGLGCIFYSILAGQHPYGKRKATEAEAAKLLLKPIKSLTSSEWKSLKSLLAFQIPAGYSIQTFEYGFFRNNTAGKGRYGVAVAVVSLVLVAIVFGLNWVSGQRIAELGDKLTSRNINDIKATLAEYSDLNEKDKVLVRDSAMPVVIERLETDNLAVESAMGYSELSQRYTALISIYHDSSKIKSLYSDFLQNKTRYIQRHENIVEARLAEHDFHEGEPSFSEVVKNLKQVDPTNAVFEEYDFKSVLAKEIGLSLYMGEEPRAMGIVLQAEKMFPGEKQRFEEIVLNFQNKVKNSAEIAESVTVEDNQYSQNMQMLENLWQKRGGDGKQAFAEFVNQLKSVDENLYYVIKSSMTDYASSNKTKASQVKQYARVAFPRKSVAQARLKADNCKPYFANRGQSSQYRCQDGLTSKNNGPALVLVKGNRYVSSFAVTRHEISINDFNLYCRLYKRCQSRPDSSLPITNISLQQAQGYARWLSKVSGKKYRLPNYQEWQLYAKDDSGIQDHNCVVTASGRLIRGNTLRSVDEGYQNSLGLVNVVGNVEEWVQDAGQMVALGGSAQHGLASCLQKKNAVDVASAAPFRGFRLVRELK